MKAPYLMTREEWQAERELLKPDCASQSNYTKGCGNKMVSDIAKLEHLCYGVHEWLHNKAVNGDTEALELLELGYDTFDMIQLKAIDEGKLYELYSQ